MKVVSSLKSLKKRDINCKVVRRRGKLYVINKKNPKFKARQGQLAMDIESQKETWVYFKKLAIYISIVIIMILVLLVFFLLQVLNLVTSFKFFEFFNPSGIFVFLSLFSLGWFFEVAFNFKQAEHTFSLQFFFKSSKSLLQIIIFNFNFNICFPPKK